MHITYAFNAYVCMHIQTCTVTYIIMYVYTYLHYAHIITTPYTLTHVRMYTRVQLHYYAHNHNTHTWMRTCKCTYITHTNTTTYTHDIHVHVHVRAYVDEHPASQTVFVSEKANLCVTTTGTTPTGYQWQRALLPGRERGKDGREEGEGEDGREDGEGEEGEGGGGRGGEVEEEKWEDIAEGRGHIGATSMRLDLPCVDTSMDGLYRCAVVKKGNACLMSNAARLTVGT